MNGKRSIDAEKRAVVDFAKSAFENSKPSQYLANCRSVECLLTEEGEDFFVFINEWMFHLETDEIKFLVPYAMEYHLFFSEDPDAEWHLEWWIMFWQHFDDSYEAIRERFDSIYASFNEREKESLCKFFRLVRELKLVDIEWDETMNFWCDSMQSDMRHKQTVDAEV